MKHHRNRKIGRGKRIEGNDKEQHIFFAAAMEDIPGPGGAFLRKRRCGFWGVGLLKCGFYAVPFWGGKCKEHGRGAVRIADIKILHMKNRKSSIFFKKQICYTKFIRCCSMINKQERTVRMTKKRKILKKEDIPLYIMAAPVVLLLLLFNYLPMGGLILAFKKYDVTKGIFGSDFNGLDNFKFLFASSDTFRIIRNTVLYNIVFIFTNMILAVVLSLMLSQLRSRRKAKVFQTIYMLPHFLSWAVVAIIVSAFLERSNGYLNHFLQMFGQEGLVDWYQKVSVWPPLLVFINAWKGVGYQAVMYLAVISGISRDYYEAAVLDGASRLQQAIYITIPHLRHIMAISLIMAVGGIFRGDFGLFYTVTQDSGMLYPVTNVIDTYIYRGLMSMANVGMTAAAGLFQSVVGFVFVLLSNKIVSRIDADSAMF